MQGSDWPGSRGDDAVVVTGLKDRGKVPVKEAEEKEFEGRFLKTSGEKLKLGWPGSSSFLLLKGGGRVEEGGGRVEGVSGIKF